jgi:hypothetical protein
MLSLPDFLDQIANITVTNVARRGATLPDAAVCVFVGCGKWPDAGTPLPMDHLVINNKEMAQHFQRACSSVTRLLEDPPGGLLESWATWGERPLSPAKAFERITLVAEDASPDSVFGVLLLLARLAGVDIRDFPREWIEAIDEWERTGVAEQPQRSWCALESALAHAYFPARSEHAAKALAQAWTAGLRFAAACLAANASPHAVPDLWRIKQWRDARSALRQEERVYLDWLQQATNVQLSLPLSVSPGRRLLIDALFVVEYQPTGAMKVFYRNDKARSPLGEGFSFAAHYRPLEQGTGNDMTIAVDPRVGVDLHDLWCELERRETEAWSRAGKTRPQDDPRWANRAECLWNEPWFINDDATLIGAPRKLSSGQLGTKLSWRDVLTAIWCVCNPLTDVTVSRPGFDDTIPLLQLTPEDAADHGKRLLLASWPRSPSPTQAVGARALGRSTIVPRLIAALIRRKAPTDDLLIDSLPVANSWQHLQLSGGFAVIAEDGLFALDDWNQQQRLDFDAVRAAFVNAARLNRDLQHLEQNAMRPLLDRFEAALQSTLPDVRGGRAAVDVDKILPEVAQIGAELARLRGSHATPNYHPDSLAIYDALDRQWQLTRRLTAIEAEVRSLETSLRSLAELRIAGISRFVAIQGFALLLAATLADALAKAFWSVFGPLFGYGRENTPEWLDLALFVFAAIVLWLTFGWLLSRRNPLRATDPK